MTELEFAYPEKLSFTCSRCGDCCRGSSVLLGPGEIESLSALDWDASDGDLAGLAPDAAVPGDPEGRRALARRDDGACIYLGSDNHCRIQQRFGYEAKPLMCRHFPFGFRPVSDRVAVDVSFACRAVSEEMGEPLARSLPEWARLAGERAPAHALYPFSRKYRVPGALLWELVDDLLEILSDETTSLVDRMRSLVEFNRLATTSDPRTDAARTLRQVLVKGIPKQMRERPLDSHRMERTGRAVFFHYLFAAINPTPPRLFALKGKAKEREVRLRVQLADGYKFPQARPLVDNWECRSTFAEIEAVAADSIARGAGASLLAKYLSAKVVGHRFFVEGDDEIAFVEAVPRLVLLAPMAAWTAKALAAERGAGAVDEQDLRRALRLVDRSLGQVRLSLLPPKQRKAWSFVLLETDLPVAATAEMLHA